MLHILHSCYSFCYIGGGFTISSRQLGNGKGLTFPFFSGFAASDASGGRRFFSDWQSVKRRLPQCLCSRQNTSWWISWHSQAIRKIHFAADGRWMLSLWADRGVPLFITDTWHAVFHAFRNLPICWNGTPSGEWNSGFITSIFQRFDFRAWNNSVWVMKLMCLTRQTILFGSRNNIVPGTFCLFSENEMYSFLKWKAVFASNVNWI